MKLLRVTYLVAIYGPGWMLLCSARIKFTENWIYKFTPNHRELLVHNIVAAVYAYHGESHTYIKRI